MGTIGFWLSKPQFHSWDRSAQHAKVNRTKEKVFLKHTLGYILLGSFYIYIFLAIFISLYIPDVSKKK